MTAPDAPLISVVVCTYNRPAALRRALDSVAQQEVDDIEIVVVDDGSDDPPDRLVGRTRGTRLIRTEHRGVGDLTLRKGMHQKEAAGKARRAADRVHEQWTWERVAKEMCADLDALSSE